MAMLAGRGWRLRLRGSPSRRALRKQQEIMALDDFRGNFNCTGDVLARALMMASSFAEVTSSPSLTKTIKHLLIVALHD